MAIKVKGWYHAKATGTSVSVNAGGIATGDTLLGILNKDDDVATTSQPTGFSSVIGFESNNNIYTEVWKKEAVSGDATKTFLLDGTPLAGGSFSVTSQNTLPNEIVWSSDGKKFFMLGSTGTASVYEYTVSEPYNLKSTVAYSNNSFSVDTQESNAQGLAFNNDGTKFFVIGPGNDTLYEYTVSVGWDLSSTVAYSGNSFSVATEAGTPYGVCFNDDGTKFFVIHDGNELVYEYTVSTGFDLSSTVAYSGNSFDTGSQELTPRSVRFNNDGTKFFIVGTTNNTIYEYTVSTGFDLSSTVAYSNNSFSVSGDESVCQGIVFNDDGSKVYVIGTNSDTLYEYDLSYNAYQWSGDSEEYVLTLMVLDGMNHSTITAGTNNTGTDAAPVSLSITPGAADSIVICGFGVDGDSTAHTLDASLTETVVEPQSATDDGQSSNGNGSAGQSIGYEYHAASATGNYTHAIASADEWTGWILSIEPAAGDTEVNTNVDALILTEQQASIALDVTVNTNVDALILTEQQADIVFDVDVLANVDNLTLTENQAAVAHDINVNANVDALTLTTQQANVELGVNVQANVDALTLTEQQATIVYDVDVPANVDALTLTENQASIVFDVDVLANVTALTLTEYQAGVELGVNVQANVDALTLTEYQANIDNAINVAANVDALTLSTYQATIDTTGDTNVDASTHALTLTELTADILVLADIPDVWDGFSGGPISSVPISGGHDGNINVAASVVNLITSTHAASISGEPGGTTINTAVDALILTEHQASIVVDIAVNANTDALTLTEYQASIGLNAEIGATVVNMTLTQLQASIVYDVNVLALSDALTLSVHTADVDGVRPSTKLKGGFVPHKPKTHKKIAKRKERERQEWARLRDELTAMIDPQPVTETKPIPAQEAQIIEEIQEEIRFIPDYLPQKISLAELNLEVAEIEAKLRRVEALIAEQERLKRRRQNDEAVLMLLA